MSIIKRGLPLIILALGCLGATPSPQKSSAPPPSGQSAALLAVGEVAPDWKLTDLEGQMHCLSDYRGRVVVMDFWATWCGPCTQLMPQMQELHEKFRDKGVVVFGLNAWETGDPGALLRKKHITYPALLKGETLAQAYGVSILPTVYVIGADGKVIYRHEGVGGKKLTKLLEQHRPGETSILR